MSEIDVLEGSLSILSTLVLICIGAIIAGLLLELPELSKRWKNSVPHWVPQTGALLVILGLAGEFGLHIWSDRVGDQIKSIQRAEIISLQKRLLPRSLTIAAQERVAAKVCPVGPQPSNMLLVAWGDQLVAGQIEGIIRRCNWVPTGIPDREAALQTVMNWLGIVFMYDPSKPGQAEASKLFSVALVAEGVAAEAKEMPAGKTLAPIIHVVINARP